MFSRIIIQLNTIRSYVIHVQYRVTHSYWWHFRQDHRLILVWDISGKIIDSYWFDTLVARSSTHIGLRH